MLDTTKIEKIVEQELRANVQQTVQEILGQKQWLKELENQIIEFVQARVLAKFNHIDSVPEIVNTVEKSVNNLFQRGSIPGIEQFVDQASISNSITSAVDQLIEKSIDNLVADPVWLNRVETLILQNYTQKITRHLSSIDINTLTLQLVDASVERWQDRLKKNFRTNGIVDLATKHQLAVHDGEVVVGEKLKVAGDLEVEGNMTVSSLAVRGAINLDNASWNELSNITANKVLENTTSVWRDQLVAEVLEKSKTSGINFSNVLIDGKEIIANGNTLNPSVVHSNITTLGQLETLTVAGKTELGSTVTVFKNRVGINTQSPEMALSVWDEEVNLIAGKLAKEKVFIGSGRKQTLALGNNRTAYVEIDETGLVTVNQLRIGKWKIGHAPEVPGYSGTRGDFVLNTNPTPGSPLGWRCLGGLQWEPVRSS